jgi:hypothetical protein
VVVDIVVVVEDASIVVVFIMDDDVVFAVFAVMEYFNPATGEITPWSAPLVLVIMACECVFDEAVFPKFMFVVDAEPKSENEMLAGISLPGTPISWTFPLSVLRLNPFTDLVAPEQKLNQSCTSYEKLNIITAGIIQWSIQI